MCSRTLRNSYISFPPFLFGEGYRSRTDSFTELKSVVYANSTNPPYSNCCVENTEILFKGDAPKTRMNTGFSFRFATGVVAKSFWSALHLHGLATVLETQSCIRPGGCPPDLERKPNQSIRQKTPMRRGGECGIRTHGGFTLSSFQDCLLKPLGHLSILNR